MSRPSWSCPNQWAWLGGVKPSIIFCSNGSYGAISGAKIAVKISSARMPAPRIANLFFYITIFSERSYLVDFLITVLKDGQKLSRVKTGENNAMKYEQYEACELCPRRCRANRRSGLVGFCGETAELRIASIGAHFGEEPPISGTNGSGTVFFSGCALQCDFCQNYQISKQHVGEIMTAEEAARQVAELYRRRGIHNVNFVTPDHFLPHAVEIATLLRAHGIELPIVWNVSG